MFFNFSIVHIFSFHTHFAWACCRDKPTRQRLIAPAYICKAYLYNSTSFRQIQANFIDNSFGKLSCGKVDGIVIIPRSDAAVFLAVPHQHRRHFSTGRPFPRTKRKGVFRSIPASFDDAVFYAPCHSFFRPKRYGVAVGKGFAVDGSSVCWAVKMFVISVKNFRCFFLSFLLFQWTSSHL